MTWPALAKANTPLVIDRATMRGRGERRELQRALSHSPIDGLGLGPDEILLIPRLTVRERLQQGGINRAFSRGFSRVLRDTLEKAQLNPSGPVGDGRPVRFSSRPKLAAWLISEPTTSEPYVSGLLAEIPGVATSKDWIRRFLLQDAAALAHASRILLSKNVLAPWIATLDEADLTVISRGLVATYGVAVTGDPDVQKLDRSYSSSNKQSAIKEPQVRTLAAALKRHLRIASLSTHQRRIAAALALLGTFPSFSRRREFQQFLSSVVPDPSPQYLEQPAGSNLAMEKPRLSEPTTERSIHETIVENSDHKSHAAGHNTGVDARRLPSSAPATGFSAQPQTSDRVREPSTDSHDLAIPPRVASPALDKPAATFVSPFCGLFFLTNLLRRIGFVDDFGLELPRSQRLAPFELIDAMGLIWFGANYRKSGLHLWLSANAASQFTARVFRHPMLERGEMAKASCKLVRDGQHVTAWHRDGFPLSDMPARSPRRATAHMAKELGRSALAGPHLHRASREQKLTRTGKSRWFSALTRCLEFELMRSGGGYSLLPGDLRLTGEVRVEDASVRVQFDLNDLQFAIRWAGLDRDPGWILEEGRSLAFVYR